MNTKICIFIDFIHEQRGRGNVDIRDCEAFWAVISFKNSKTFRFFEIVGKSVQSAKLLDPTFLGDPRYSL